MGKERFTRGKDTDEEVAKGKHIPAKKKSKAERVKLKRQGILPEAAAIEEVVPANVPGADSWPDTIPATDFVEDFADPKPSQDVDVSPIPDVDVSRARNPFFHLDSPDLGESKAVSNGSVNGVIGEETPVEHKPDSATGRTSETPNRRKESPPYDVVLRYQKMGVPNADIAANLQERGLTPEQVKETFYFVERDKKKNERRLLRKAMGNIHAGRKLVASLGSDVAETKPGTSRYAQEQEEEQAIDRLKSGREPKEVTPLNEDPLFQVETKPGTSWYTEEQKLQREQDRSDAGREPQKATPIDEGPLAQVETAALPGSDEVWPDTIPGAIDSNLSVPPASVDITRRESRAKFEDVMERARERFARENAKNQPKAEDLSANIKERSTVLDTEAMRMGKAEKFFRSLGEKYNKHGWKSKLVVGGLLVLGAAGVSTVSTPLTMLFGGLIATQRALGMAGVFIHLEKHLQSTAAGRSENFLGKREWYQKFISSKSEKTRENIAAGLAMVWSYGMGAAIAEGVREFDQSEWGQQVHNFLRHHYPFGSTEQPVSGRLRSGVVPQEAPHAASAPASAPEAGQSTAAAAAPPIEGHAPRTPSAVAGAAHARPPILEVSVNASKGHGYEWMVKRIWEQLQQQQGMDLKEYFNTALPEDQQSDLYKLLKATPETIDKVVHQIAADPKHAFFNPDGSSVAIDPSAQLSIGVDGQVHFSDASHPDMLHAAEGMRVTPEYSPEPKTYNWENSSIQEKANTVKPEGRIAPFDNPDTLTTNGEPNGLAPEHSPISSESISNQFGLHISPAEAHVYAGAEEGRLYVYGGDAEMQRKIVSAYLAKNPHTVVFGADHAGNCIPWHMVQGEAVPGPVMRSGGVFGLFSSSLRAPGPEMFKTIIT